MDQREFSARKAVSIYTFTRGVWEYLLSHTLASNWFYRFFKCLKSLTDENIISQYCFIIFYYFVRLNFFWYVILPFKNFFWIVFCLVNLLICVFNCHICRYFFWVYIAFQLYVSGLQNALLHKEWVSSLQVCKVFKKKIFSWSVFIRCFVMLLKNFPILRIVKVLTFISSFVSSF